MSYAIIKTGGHQYKVEEGRYLTVDKLEGNVGDAVSFGEVLMIGGNNPQFGAPLISGAKVEGFIKEQIRNPKILVLKYKRRKNHKKMRGHRQPMTVIQINKIFA